MPKAQYFCIITESTSTFHLLGARLHLFLMQARHTSWPLLGLPACLHPRFTLTAYVPHHAQLSRSAQPLLILPASYTSCLLPFNAKDHDPVEGTGSRGEVAEKRTEARLFKRGKRNKKRGGEGALRKPCGSSANKTS